MASVDHLLLPEEIWREILVRLPVKSILRCRSVCKSWYSLISYNNFTSYYESKNLNNGRNHILLKFDNVFPDEVFGVGYRKRDIRAKLKLYTYQDNSFIDSGRLGVVEFPEPFRRGNFQVVGSCNGLICLMEGCAWPWRGGEDLLVHNFMIWNPSIRKVVKLPSISLCTRLAKHPCYYGFGFDRETGDFKVLCIVREVATIFDLKKGVWRQISPTMHSWGKSSDCPECYLDSNVHWSASRDIKNVDKILLSFNMSSEDFREIQMPDRTEFNEYLIKTTSFAYDGLVHILAAKMDHNNKIDMKEKLSIWKMKVYGELESWTKVFNIELPNAQILPFTFILPHTLHLWEGEVFMAHEHLLADDDKNERETEFVLYDTKSEKFKSLLSMKRYISYICFYKESLFLM